MSSISKKIKTSALLSNAILALVFTGIFLIVFFGLASDKAVIANSFNLSTPAATPVTISAIFTAMLAAFWGYQGWATIGYLGGEIKDPTRNIPKGIAIGVFIVIRIPEAMTAGDVAALRLLGHRVDRLRSDFPAVIGVP